MGQYVGSSAVVKWVVSMIEKGFKHDLLPKMSLDLRARLKIICCDKDSNYLKSTINLVYK